MGRLDVYANPDAAERKHTPYFLDVQNDYIAGLETRVVIPLRRETAFGPRARALHPLVTLRGEKFVLDTAAIGAVPTAELRKVVGHLADARAEIQEALDALFGAY
ncbi:MAG: CcdB family protein [Burkholderiales bacterium]|nr:CcdB family protein [Burkholderiales bacterium]